MDQDEQHLSLLSTCHYVLGGIAAFFSCLPFIHIAVGVALVSGRFEEWGPGGASGGMGGFARPLGWLFIVFPAVIVLTGWGFAVCIIVAGRKLAQHRSRTFCLVIAAIECLMMPLGTILGVFTIVVLMRPSVVDLFGGSQALPATPR